MIFSEVEFVHDVHEDVLQLRAPLRGSHIYLPALLTYNHGGKGLN